MAILNNKTSKILVLGFFTLLLVGALVIRENESAYLAYKKGDYPLALKEFIEDAKSGDPQATYYVGRIYYDAKPAIKDYKKAAQWFWESAKLGNMDGAIFYLSAAERAGEFDTDCRVRMDVQKLAVHTGTNTLSTLMLGDEIMGEICGPKNRVLAAYYYYLGGLLDRRVGSKFHEQKRRMTNEELAAFEKIKNDRPPSLSKEDFFKQYFSLLKGPK